MAHLDGGLIEHWIDFKSGEGKKPLHRLKVNY
ncbi:uncharacterized protein METZ01_LOCUS119839 [marine metagenome]|uniref:Uncharacterized protein n=1 Tax=marine metagenome TaxID=408172 RepID=A0A381XQH0_9ZZZZ